MLKNYPQVESHKSSKYSKLDDTKDPLVKLIVSILFNKSLSNTEKYISSEFSPFNPFFYYIYKHEIYYARWCAERSVLIKVE